MLASTATIRSEAGTTAMGTYMFTKFGFNFASELGHHDQFRAARRPEPELEDSLGAQVSFLWRPTGRLRVDTNYLLTEVDDRGGAGEFSTIGSCAPVELPVHEGVVAALHRAAQADESVAAHTPRGRRKPELRRARALRDQSVVGAVRRLQHELEQLSARRFGAGHRDGPYRRSRARRQPALHEVLLPAAAVAHGSFAGPARTSV